MTLDPSTPNGASDAAPKVDCNGALAQLFDYLDGELDDAFEARLKAHVEDCRHCFERADFERRFLEALQAARAEQLCPAKLRERVIGTLRAQGVNA